MNLKTKKVIAREGLIVLGFLLFAIIACMLERRAPDVELAAILIFYYSVHWAIRFVVWAIMTLRKKE